MRNEFWLKVTLVLSLLAISWWSRFLWLHPIDQAYLETYYQQSQWRDPKSTRIISDNELYQVAGLHLVKDRDFFVTNPEVPPVGKYLYGWARVLTGNPLTATGLVFVGCLLMIWLIGKELRLTTAARWLSLVLLVLTPLFSSQLSQTMLDLPQLLWFLLHVWAMLKVLAIQTPGRKGKKTVPLTWQQRLWPALVAGVSLGLFAGTKIAFFGPLILIIDTVFLFYRGLWLNWLLLVISSGITYLGSYALFLLDHSLLELLKAQKWMLTFYAQSKVRAIPGMIFATSLVGTYRGWWTTQGWSHVGEWSVSWALSVASVVVWSWLTLSNTTRLVWRKQWSQLLPQDLVGQYYLAGLGCALIVANIIIPFWPRYFLLILPVGILLVSQWLLQHKVATWLIIAICAAQTVWFFRGSPHQTMQFLQQTWRTGHFADSYNFLSTAITKDFTREHFVAAAESQCGHQPVKIRFEVADSPWLPIFANRWEGKLTYDQSVRELPIVFVREGNQWRIASPPSSEWCRP